MKIDPPTHIEAHIRCTHVTRPSATAICGIMIISRYIIDAAAVVVVVAANQERF
jgi:hypothetical protein